MVLQLHCYADRAEFVLITWLWISHWWEVFVVFHFGLIFCNLNGLKVYWPAKNSWWIMQDIYCSAKFGRLERIQADWLLFTLLCCLLFGVLRSVSNNSRVKVTVSTIGILACWYGTGDDLMCYAIVHVAVILWWRNLLVFQCLIFK